MKRTFLLLTGFIGATALHAQLKEGTIFYDQKINMHRSIQDEQMRAMIPEFRTTKYQLQFSDSVSLYKAVPEDEAPDPFAGGGGGGPRVFTRMGAGAGDMYKNYSQMKSVQSTEMGGKSFLIVDSIRQQPWKIGTETKIVLGHTCHKATRKITQGVPVQRRVMMNGGVPASDTTIRTPQTKEVEVVAWYAEDITAPAGPENYGQLPGVILQLDIDNAATVYTATDIKKTVEQKDLKEPKKGKVVTPKEFSKVVSDMMGNMQMGGGGTIRF